MDREENFDPHPEKPRKNTSQDPVESIPEELTPLTDKVKADKSSFPTGSGSYEKRIKIEKSQV